MISVNEIYVDGQLVIVPTIESWVSILESPLYEGLPIYSEATEKIVRHLVGFISMHKKLFCLGLVRAKFIKKSWTVLVLFKVGDIFQRVQIEYPTCSSCGWHGAIANPTDASLYFGVIDELQVTRRAFMLRRLPCPRCEKELPRFAIWTE